MMYAGKAKFRELLFNLQAPLVCFLSGFLLVRYATAWGIGTQPDSACYLSVAENLLSGKGLTDYTGHLSIHFPLGYSLILAFGSKLTWLDVRFGMPRFLGALCFGALGVITYILTKKASQDRQAAALAAFAVLGSSTILWVHSMALSEAPFLLLSAIGICFLLEFSCDGQKRWLRAAALTLGFSVLIRYVGIVWIPSGAIVIFIVRFYSGSKVRLNAIVNYLLLSLIPWTIWSVFTLTATGTMTDRKLAFHPINIQVLKAGLAEMGGWLWHTRTPMLSLVWVIIFSIALIYCYREFSQDRPKPEGLQHSKYFPSLLLILLVFSISYFLFLIFSMTFIDRATPLDGRTLSIVSWMWLIVLVLAIFMMPFKSELLREVWKFCSFIVLLVLFCLQINKVTMPHLGLWHEQGIGLSRNEYRDHSVWKFTRSLPLGVTIVSNTPWSIYLTSGRMAKSLPTKENYTSGKKNPYYSQQLRTVLESIASGKALLLYWHRKYQDPLLKMPSINELDFKHRISVLFQSAKAIVIGRKDSVKAVEEIRKKER